MATDTKKIVLITGGNTGLGYQVIKSLLKSQGTSYEILMGSRSVDKGDQAVAKLQQEVPHSSSSVSVVQADISSDSSIDEVVDLIKTKYGRLDVLVNNAGAGFDRAIQDSTLSIRAAFNQTWDTNVSGTQVLTTLAMPLLFASSDPRLLFITSGTSSLTETESTEPPAIARINAPPQAGWPKPPHGNPIAAYRSAKTGLNMLFRDWCRVLGNDHVKLWAVSPGFLATGLSGVGAEAMKKMGAQDPEVGGEFVRDVVEGKYDGKVGRIIRKAMVQPY
ncbi:hypothetical protein LTR62_000946 [Meristemomyces frigidus]|uniref:Ketoreductase domain-containing protein n=1 Tax=Meristemomyces frigidus TaxID=1508187 RepID=A0AAN7TH24_9PEZI|nr:hypothetical protein LTR62_000946 [Meristemomyces frigidus]